MKEFHPGAAGKAAAVLQYAGETEAGRQRRSRVGVTDITAGIRALNRDSAYAAGSCLENITRTCDRRHCVAVNLITKSRPISRAASTPHVPSPGSCASHNQCGERDARLDGLWYHSRPQESCGAEKDQHTRERVAGGVRFVGKLAQFDQSVAP